MVNRQAELVGRERLGPEGLGGPAGDRNITPQDLNGERKGHRRRLVEPVLKVGERVARRHRVESRGQKPPRNGRNAARPLRSTGCSIRRSRKLSTTDGDRNARL